MARIIDKCRLCRREGIKLYLKGERCYTAKCPIEKKGAVPPGQHGPRGHRRLSSYGQQLREKQKLRRYYSVMEKTMRRYFKQAAKSREATGEAFLRLLERRLDNVVFSLGLAPSRSVARQLVSHRHVLVDGQVVNIASYLVKPEQVVNLSTKALKLNLIKKSLAEKDRRIPEWLKRKAAAGKIIRLPEREDIDLDINESLIVEYYSKQT